MHLSPKNGSIVWADGETCNVDLRFEVHGGTISFADRAQMVSPDEQGNYAPTTPQSNRAETTAHRA